MNVAAICSCGWAVTGTAHAIDTLLAAHRLECADARTNPTQQVLGQESPSLFDEDDQA